MKVQVCHGRTCTERFCEYINTRLENDKKKFGINIEIENAACMGQCKKGPNIKLKDEIHNHINPAKASEMIQGKEKKKK